ncbi:MAG: ATP-dependent endonuclease [Candidatus Zixiibacteriota bacterium]
MRISRLQIDNFRSLRSLDVEVPNICALVGPNNSGKSNILLALYRVLARDWVTVNSFMDNDVYCRNPELDIRIEVTLDPPPEYKAFKYADPVDVPKIGFEFTRYQVGEKTGQRRLEQKCSRADGRPVQVLKQAPKQGQQHKYQPLVGIPSEVREQIPLIYIGTHRLLKDHLPAARNSLLRPLLEDINRDLHDLNNLITIHDDQGEDIQIPRAERYRALMDEILKLLRTDEFTALEKAIKEEALRQLGFDPATDTDALDFFFAPFDTMDFYRSLDLCVREGDFVVSATELGEGVQNALVLAILQAFEARRKQGAILLIEEPEMFLHPQKQRSLYKTLRAIGKTNQIIYTTHSPHFVSVPDYNEVLIVRKSGNDTYVITSDLPTDKNRREKLRKELDPERNELFFATRLLLVEGDTEKLAFPEYATRLGLDVDRAGATVVEVGGKKSLLEFTKIAQSFEIPTGIVYDKDSSDFGNNDDEQAYNNELDALAQNGDNTHTWQFDKDYETELQAALGDEMWQKKCQQYADVTRKSKPIRARMIASDAETPIPEKVNDILLWFIKGDAPRMSRAGGSA